MSEKKPIPIPLKLVWREFVARFVPVIVFGAVLVAAFVFWRQRLGPASIPGEAETVQAIVTAPTTGVLTELGVRSFQQVRAGEVVGKVVANDPKQPGLLVSPIEGAVTYLHAAVGDKVGAGLPVLTVTGNKPDRIVAFLRQPIAFVPEEGASVTIRPRSRSGSVQATIQRVGLQLAPIRRTLLPYAAGRHEDLPVAYGLPVIVNVPPQLKLLPGEIVELTLQPGLADRPVSSLAPVLMPALPPSGVTNLAPAVAGTTNKPVAVATPTNQPSAGPVSTNRPPSVLAAANPPPAPPATGAGSQDTPVNLSSRVNASVDNAAALGLRLAELPLFVVLAAVTAVCAVLLLLAGRLVRGGRSRRFVFVTLIGVATVFCLVTADRRIAMAERQIRRLQGEVAKQAGALRSAPGRGVGLRHLLFDRAEAEKALKTAFGEVQLLSSTYDEASDLVLIRLLKEPVHACLAIVDLTHPGVEIKLDSAIGNKTLTSAFARTNRCTIAINGEAGNSPSMDSGLGEWTGNFVSAGRAILLKDTDKRPFLAFDRRNRASYSPARFVETSQAPDWYNVIWGRHDALTNGVPIAPAQDERQPRTAMAIDKAGARLYLLVADGRQPGYSTGLTRREVALLLAAFGAHDGMLCDEGGSSCLYASQPDGIVNAPCDAGGKERPTYTHFGVALRPGERQPGPAVATGVH